MMLSFVFNSFRKGGCCTLFVLAAVFSFGQTTTIKVACVGNSVTFGAGLKNRESTAYPSVLQKMLGAGYEVRNFGHSGATLLRKGHNPYAATKAFADAVSFAADVVIIHLGLNDTDPRNWPEYRDEFAADYAWLIDTFRKTNPSASVYISRLTPIFHDHPRFRSGTRDWFWQIQNLIPQIAAANNSRLIDLHTPLYAHPWLFPDALHPNEEGASILAATIYKRITGNYGGLAVPYFLASGMVLQRYRPILFYGTADAGARISVAFNKLQHHAVADDNGQWKISFPAMQEGGPYEAVVSSGTRTIMLEDILIGDVWLCAGQSNMDFPLQSAINNPDEMLQAQHLKTIRLLNREPIAETANIAWDSATLEKINRLQYFSGTWQPCDSVTAKKFSAVGYYFARQLQKELQVPIGLIQVAVGGSTAESWIDRYSLEHHPVLVNELYQWRRSDFFSSWVRQRADTNLKNAANPKQRHPYEPAYNFEAGIAPLTSFPIKGVIWYQGESNAHNAELHEQVFPALVDSWRQQWVDHLPFYYVQLSSLNRPSWPAFRFSQLQLLQKIPNSGMAVSSDLGDPGDVHPRKKKEIGERLARLALHFTYHRKNVVPHGPLPLNAFRDGKRIVVSFQSTGSELKTGDGRPLRGFSITTDKGFTTDVPATIEKDKVIIPLGAHEMITELKYGWKPYTDANLVNEAGLPASTFRLTVSPAK